MNCETCGVDTGMHALSDKPDPGYGYNTHTWEQCARELLKRATLSATPTLREHIERLLERKDGRRKLIEDAMTLLEVAKK